jgi:hypothetical protein
MHGRTIDRLIPSSIRHSRHALSLNKSDFLFLVRLGRQKLRKLQSSGGRLLWTQRPVPKIASTAAQEAPRCGGVHFKSCHRGFTAKKRQSAPAAGGINMQDRGTDLAAGQAA